MLDHLWVALPVSVVLGFLSGLGTGGGSLLILWLTFGLGMAQGTARTINLMFFIPAALVACLYRWRQGSFDPKKIIPAIIGGCLAAWFFSRLGADMDLAVLKKLFGALLIYTGIRELLYRQK